MTNLHSPFDELVTLRGNYPNFEQFAEEEAPNDVFNSAGIRFDGLKVIAEDRLYHDIVTHLLNKVFPPNIYKNIYEIEKNIPFVYYTECVNGTGELSLIVVYKNKSGGFKFIFDMLSRWLSPGKKINIPTTFNADFRISSFNDEVFSICETIIQPETTEQFEEIKRNLPIIDTEIRLGVNSDYFANRIMEVKGLSSDQKTGLIQEQIVNLIKRQSKNLDHDVFIEMQHLLVICQDSFKNAREVRHLSRLITLQFLFRKEIRKLVNVNPEERYLFLKLFRAKLNVNGEKKNVLSIVIGLNFLRDKEIFEEKHIIKALQNHIPQVRAIHHSFFDNKHGSEKICTLYLEIEKSNGYPFSSNEIQLLRKKLPDDLKDKIEHMMHPVFNPRNEEEIMRNILSLSNQIKFIRDIPQVFINFDEQTLIHVYFTVILVRVLKAECSSIQKMFEGKKTALEYLHDRCKKVGSLRKKYAKEANVFRVRLLKDQFLRKDNSIDLYKARQKVVTELCNVVGDFRDFNGGMISKQNELLGMIKELLAGNVIYNDLLLENFFYSLTPVIMRTVLDPETLKNLFLMIQEAIEEGFFNEDKNVLNVRSDDRFVYIVATIDDPAVDLEIQRKIEELKQSSTSVAISRVKVYDMTYIGYIYRSDDDVRTATFKEIIHNAIKSAKSV